MKQFGITLVTIVAVVSILLAAATVWLFLTNPMTVASAVNDGDVSPLVKNLAEAIFAALSGLLKYL